ncbi:MAG: ABC transporter permease [Planctomycetota bacterium]|nr:ABC transporter permease [Planctomycetota bacterium]
MPEGATKSSPLHTIGRVVLGAVEYVGGLALLGARTLTMSFRGFLPGGHFRWGETTRQVVRIGTKSLGIVVAGQLFIGVILALQIAPPLKPWGQVDKLADIIGVGGFRMLGPILAGIILTGFAGASIAAEISTMVVGEEVEALETMALDPVEFLVVPRVIASFTAMILLTMLSDVMIAAGGYLTSCLAMGPEVYLGYWRNMKNTLGWLDCLTGLIQGGVFGILISLIACREGLHVRGGAEGVGRAVTTTVVYSIAAIIFSACIFTVIFYTFRW